MSRLPKVVGIGETTIIRYRDHVLFRNTDPNLYRPTIRECIGWIIKEDNEAVWVLWDRSLKPLPHERIQTGESGLVLLKSDILEMRKVD